VYASDIGMVLHLLKTSVRKKTAGIAEKLSRGDKYRNEIGQLPWLPYLSCLPEKIYLQTFI
jgi:hypothetical protein